MKQMTIREAQSRGIHLLSQTSPDQRGVNLDVRVLLMHVLGVESTTLYAYPERMLTPEQQRQFLSLIERRQRGEPVAYLVGHKEFYGLDFLVDARVLIPRPETELLVETALAGIRTRIAAGRLPIVADIGTGSGAIPITLAVEEPRLPFVYACDISPDALDVARSNCQRHHVEARVRLLQGDLLEPLPEPVDILLANLPYVGTTETESLAPDVYAYEPHQALFSGQYGLDLLQRFCKEAREFGTLKVGSIILLEIGYQQCQPLTDLIKELWPQARVTCTQDYAGWDRLLQVNLL
ncbi:MAG: peptide chain release factor N(5)-glutamine methyltransferase [Ktedonobacteraceae bacterium]|nr:peptide chain release factor N(5)-glutamine methyltransferase [Ktedonobacteraceae bacterium]